MFKTAFLPSLPESYNMVVSILETNTAAHLQMSMSRAMEEYRKIRSKTETIAMQVGTPKKSRPKDPCLKCMRRDKQGHVESRC